MTPSFCDCCSGAGVLKSILAYSDFYAASGTNANDAAYYRSATLEATFGAAGSLTRTWNAKRYYADFVEPSSTPSSTVINGPSQLGTNASYNFWTRTSPTSFQTTTSVIVSGSQYFGTATLNYTGQRYSANEILEEIYAPVLEQLIAAPWPTAIQGQQTHRSFRYIEPLPILEVQPPLAGIQALLQFTIPILRTNFPGISFGRTLGYDTATMFLEASRQSFTSNYCRFGADAFGLLSSFCNNNQPAGIIEMYPPPLNSLSISEREARRYAFGIQHCTSIEQIGRASCRERVSSPV